MPASRTTPRATLDAWRMQGADRLNPVRFHFIDALERRATSHDGEARRLLDSRLAQLLAAYADGITAAGPIRTETMPHRPPRGELAALADELARRVAARSGPPNVNDATTPLAPRTKLEAVDDLQKIWSTVRIESQLRQALEQVPADAGPLNSARLVHRSLTLMRELSPEYLQQFLSYVDALSWIEQMRSNSTSGKDAARAGSAGKRTRRKPR